MHTNRFELALERLGSGDWEKFEKLASIFLAAEFPNLRTLANASGDAGRDAVIFAAQNEPTVALQYSVTSSWASKITDTVKTLAKKHPEVALLIYVTSQLIGARADDLVTKMRKDYRISVDIRDRNWFIERVNSDTSREAAAEQLAKEVVDPYLASREIISQKAQALDGVESRAAFVFLGLQLEDDTREKGLTRLSFEALVRAALRDTNSDNRLTRADIHKRVEFMLPNHPAEIVVRFTDSALAQLKKKTIRHWQLQDEFCLTFDEGERIRDRLIDVETADRRLQLEIQRAVQSVSPLLLDPGLSHVISRVRRILESYLLSRGELFASTVKTGVQHYADNAEIERVAIEDIAVHGLEPDERDMGADGICTITQRVLSDPGDEVHAYLRTLSDAYTLLAFLRETPDVQRVVRKMFETGDIWLDTNIVLPLLAEDLIPEGNRRFTAMIHATVEAGIVLHITPGVLEEIESHMSLSLTCARVSNWTTWVGLVPFLYSVFIQSGGNVRSFPQWIERFKGEHRPMDDIAEYLAENYRIQVTPLTDVANQAPEDLKAAVQNVWQIRHEKRRQRQPAGGDSLLAARLSKHDVENYLGVLMRRGDEAASPLGYTSWWLTLDRAAFEIARDLQTQFTSVSSPIMSPDFLTNYLTLGPIRNRVASELEKLLPVVVELRQMESISPELLDVADKVREQYKDLPEYLIRRKVRDELDAAKTRRGALAIGGLQAIEDQLVHTGS